MLMKGKMVRPTLLLLASEVEGSAEPRAAAFAAVLELIHLATLVHDDAVDHSVLRRGMPTINSLFTHQVSVIAGDFLYSRAVQELVRLEDMEALRVFANAANELTVGEMRQLGALDALAFSESDYEFLIKCKTAALFKAACDVGALCGAARYRGQLARFGERLGMAFQVQDDLIDYTEDSGTTGKPTGLDLKEHKVTLPLIEALRRVDGAQRRVIERLFATPTPDDEQIARWWRSCARTVGSNLPAVAVRSSRRTPRKRWRAFPRARRAARCTTRWTTCWTGGPDGEIVAVRYPASRLPPRRAGHRIHRRRLHDPVLPPLPAGGRGEGVPYHGRHTIGGALHVDLVILKFVLGPPALDVSLLSLVGVLIAYLIARFAFLGAWYDFGNLGFMEILPDPRGRAAPLRGAPTAGDRSLLRQEHQGVQEGLSDVDRTLQDEARNNALPPRPAEPLQQDQESQPEPKRLIS